MASLETRDTEKAMEKIRQEEIRQAALDGTEGNVAKKEKVSCTTKVVGVFVSAGVKVKILISLYQVLNGLGVIFNSAWLRLDRWTSTFTSPCRLAAHAPC